MIHNIEWTYCWDYVGLANILLMANLTNNNDYKEAVAWNLKWFNDSVSKTPAGLPYLNNWGSLRYATAEAGIAYLYYKYFNDERYLGIANNIIDYCLGDNPLGMTYLTNYGTNSPKHPHHRANEPVRGGTTKGLIGALVGGPNNKDQYVDDVNSYEYTEVALDYNAVFLLGCSGSSYVSRNSEPATIPTTATITTAPSGTISPTTPSASVSPQTLLQLQHHQQLPLPLRLLLLSQ